MMLITEDKDVKTEAESIRSPNVEMAKVKIKLALLKYQVAVRKSIQATEKKKVRL